MVDKDLKREYTIILMVDKDLKREYTVIIMVQVTRTANRINCGELVSFC